VNDRGTTTALLDRDLRGKGMAVRWILFGVAAAGLAATSAAQDGRRGPGRQQDRAPKVGADAPDFKLKRLDDADVEVELSSFKGRSPVVLIFGSYT
jgi:hypothetical protein